jgi:hypothetical protein
VKGNADGSAVVVLGAGIVGCSIAVHLLDRGVRPVLGRLVAREVADDTADGRLAPFRPGRFAERATRVMLEVESVFREPTRQDRST